jgi:predicted transcriptional regulator
MPEDKRPAYPHVEKNPKKLVRGQQALVIRAMRSEVSTVQSALNTVRDRTDRAVKAATRAEKNVDELQAAWDNEIEHRHLDPSSFPLPELQAGPVEQCHDALVRLEELRTRYNELRKILATLSKRK